MSNAALLDLRARILSNTLTAAQQGALAAALDEVEPTFPTPDELANSIPQFEGALARDWYASLYSIALGNGAMPPPPPGGISDVTGTDPIDVTTPSTGVRNVAISPATTADAGSLSAADKTKLDALNPAAQVTFANDLAGSDASHQWLASVSGPGGVAGPVPIVDGGAWSFLGTGPVADSGQLRFPSDGVPYTSASGWITMRRPDNTGDLPALAYDKDHGALVLGNWGVDNPAAGWPVLYLASVARTFLFNGTTSSNDNTGGQWTFFGAEVPNVLNLFNDDWTVMWEQGTPGKDGRRRPLGYNSTFQTSRDNVFVLDVATNQLVDNAINCPEYIVIMWDYLTDAPAYRWAAWRLTKTFGVIAGVPTPGVVPAVVTLIDEFPAGASVGVSPDFAIDGNSVVIQVTPPVATGVRWYAGIDMPQVSDPGLDQAPNVPDGPIPP
jgi:hypothetical protein